MFAADISHIFGDVTLYKVKFKVTKFKISLSKVEQINISTDWSVSSYTF